MIIPSIDLMDGKAVQLERGRKKVLERTVDEMLDAFSLARELQVIDLDAAMKNGSNESIVAGICRKANVRFGGGMNTIKKAEKMISYGAGKVIIGSMAERGFLKELCDSIGKEKIVVALDSENGKIVKDAWKTNTGQGVEEKIAELEEFCGEFFFTFVENEGTMKGIDVQKAVALKKLTK